MDPPELARDADPLSHAAPHSRLPFRVLLAYGGPTLGIAYLLFFVQFYFLKFSTDVLLLPPLAIGLIFAAAKIWDAASNPLVGSWSDRGRSRLGRRRPFMFAALPLLVAGFIMLWTPPPGLKGEPLVVWSAFALFVFYGAFALYTIPHFALGTELSPDSHERTRIFGVRQMSLTIGILVAFVGIQLAMNAANPRAAASGLALPGALAAAAILALTPLFVREPVSRAGDGGHSLFAGLRDVWANPPARSLLWVWLVENAGVGVVGTMAPYVAEYVLRRPGIVGLLPGAYVVSGVAAIPFWVWVSRSVGKRETWLVTMLLAACAFGGMGFVGAGDVGLTIALLVFAGAAMGSGSVLSSSILADVIDLDAKRTGERKEGVYAAAMTFVMKMGVAGVTAVSGFVLSAAGFKPNVEQSVESLLGIRLLFAGLPCLGFLVGAWLFWRASFAPGQPSVVARTVP
ncbi:MAG TPA: MFS transporter [Myxococcota bacterium]|nr:MFS transporter [Myxococcota bacterium]